MIAGMLAMMELCIRVRNRNAPYIIGVRQPHPPSRGSRRLVNGKTLVVVDELPSNDLDHDILIDESTPIQPVASNSTSSSTSSSTTSLADAGALLPPETSQSQTSATPYHQQDSIEIECALNNCFVAPLDSSRQYNSIAANSSNEHDHAVGSSNSSQGIRNQPAIESRSQTAGHSYSDDCAPDQVEQLPVLFKCKHFYDEHSWLSH